MLLTRALCLAFAAATLVWMPPGARAAAPIPGAEKLLPDDTLFVMTVPDVKTWREHWKSSPQTKLWDDPAMKPFRDKLMNQVQEQLVKPLERELGIHFEDYAQLPQGQLTFAITQNGWQGGDDPEPAAILLLDARDKGDQLKAKLAELRAKWVDAGKTIRTERVRNVEFLLVPLSTNDIPQSLRKLLPEPQQGFEPAEGDKPAAKPELIIGQFESLLIVGSSLKAIEKVAVHLTGGSMPALADVADFQANYLRLFRDSPAYGWVNLKALIDVMNQKAGAGQDSDVPDPLAVMNPDRILSAIGIKGLRSAALNMAYGRDGSSVELFLSVPESSRQGLFKLFPSQGKESAPPPFVPADVMKFQRCRIDGQKAWATLQSVLNDLSPQMLSSVKFLIDSANTGARQKDPGFDLNQSLFGNLGDDMISYQKAPRGSTLADINAAPSLILIGSPQPEKLAGALNVVAGLMNAANPPTDREFLGRTIYSVALPGVPVRVGGSNAPAPRKLNFAASGGYVGLSMDASTLEEFIRSGEGQQKSLRETQGLTDAFGRVGGMSTGWAGYENQAESSRALFDLLRQFSSDDGDSPALKLPQYDLWKKWVDFSLLPPFDQVARYFYFSVYTVASQPDGVSFRVFAPVPPALR